METPGTGLGLTLPSAAEAASPPSPPLTTSTQPHKIKIHTSISNSEPFSFRIFVGLLYCNSMLDIKMLHRWVDNIDISADY